MALPAYPGNAKSVYNNEPGSGRTGYWEVPPNNYDFYSEDEKYKPVVQPDGGVLSSACVVWRLGPGGRTRGAPPLWLSAAGDRSASAPPPPALASLSLTPSAAAHTAAAPRARLGARV